MIGGFALAQAIVLFAAQWHGDRWIWASTLALVGAGLLALTLVPRLVWPAAAAALTVWVLALPVLGSTDPVSLRQSATYLAIVGFSLLAMSFKPGRVPLIWIAAAVGSLAVWLEFSDLGESTMESYTATSAALLLAAGLLHYRVQRGLGSLAVLGAPLSMALLPSTLLACSQASTGEGVLRAALVIVGASLLAIAGAVLRMRAPLLIGLFAAVVAGIGQVVAYSHLVPRWLALAVAGVLLVGAGFTAEPLGRTGRHAWRTAQKMR
jgi:hypothetical protein